MTAAVQRDSAVALIERATRWLDETVADGELRAGWSLPVDAALVLGSSQPLHAVDARDLPVVRRGTGGGAVICDADYLMLDVVLPAGDPRIRDDLAESYRWLSDALLSGLEARGARGVRAVALGTVRGAPDVERAAGRAACWAGLGPYELVDERGHKLIGLAQRRRRGAALFQAAAYLRGDHTALADLLVIPEDIRTVVRDRLGRVAALGLVAPGFVAAPPAIC